MLEQLNVRVKGRTCFGRQGRTSRVAQRELTSSSSSQSMSEGTCSFSSWKPFLPSVNSPLWSSMVRKSVKGTSVLTCSKLLVRSTFSGFSYTYVNKSSPLGGGCTYCTLALTEGAFLAVACCGLLGAIVACTAEGLRSARMCTCGLLLNECMMLLLA